LNIVIILGKRWVPVDIPITTLKPESVGKRGRNGRPGNTANAKGEERTPGKNCLQ
jgi:hypothetical protein